MQSTCLSHIKLDSILLAFRTTSAPSLISWYRQGNQKLETPTNRENPNQKAGPKGRGIWRQNSHPSVHPSTFKPSKVRPSNQSIPCTSSPYSSHGKSCGSIRVHVKYGSPPSLRSSSRKFRISGLTASLALFFISSILRSNRFRLSRLYESGLRRRKRLHSSWER
jgi:hypothetical protein